MSEVLARVSIVGDAEPSFLAAVHRGLASLWSAAPGVRRKDRMAFEHAVTAVVGISILYASGPDVSVPALWVELEALDERLFARVREVGVEPSASPVPTPLRRPATAASARGFAIVPTLLTEFRCEHTDGISTWILGRRTEG